LPPELGPFLSSGRYRVLAELGYSPFKTVVLLKLSLMVSADCEAKHNAAQAEHDRCAALLFPWSGYVCTETRHGPMTEKSRLMGTPDGISL
jgi:hypothetical protein